MQKRRQSSYGIPLALSLVFSLWVGNAFAASASSSALGQLSVDGKTITLNHAYAVTGPDSFDGTKESFLVLLTEKPLAPNAIKDATSAEALGEKSVRSLLESGLAVQIGPDKGYHLTIRHPALKDHELQRSGFSGLTIVTLGPDRVAGTFASSSGMGRSEGDGGVEEITPNHTAQFKIHFDVPVSRRFALEEKLELGPHATKLPAGGGEPGKAWLDSACKPAPKLPNSKDLKAVEKYLVAQGMTEKDMQEEVSRMSKQEGHPVTREQVIQKMADMMGAMANLGDAIAPKNCKVLGGGKDGKIAIIQVEATMGGGRVATDVTLTTDGSAWVVKKTGAWRSPP
ncbi:MAG: hypothetical protein ABI837_13675 [Acidobacteriota bacterium]